MRYDSLEKARSVNTRISIRRADCDPSDDRPCTTTHLQWQGPSILEYQYIYIYIHIDTPTNTITNTNTGIDHLLNAQANTSINADITLFYSLKRICLINIGINTPTHINNHLRIDISVY